MVGTLFTLSSLYAQSVPVIPSGDYAKLLTTRGVLTQDGHVLENDGLKNVIKNNGFEIPSQNWTASPSSAIEYITSSSQPTQVAYGNRALKFDATANAQTVVSDVVTIPNALNGVAGVAKCSFLTAASDYKIQLYKNGVLDQESTIAANTIFEQTQLQFTFPTSGAKTVQLRLISQSNALPLYVDECYVGEQAPSTTSVFGASALPNVDNTYDLGSPSQNWRNLYIGNNVYIDGNLQMTSLGTGVLHSDSSGNVTSSLIVNADVSSSAAIARSKLAGGSASQIVVNDGAGALSSVAVLNTARGGTGLSSTGTANQFLRMDGTGSALEYDTITSDDIPEGATNIYATSSSVRAFISASAPLVYNSSSGVMSIPQATSSSSGYLLNTDWQAFDAKQPAGNYVTSLTGEVTASGPGASAATVANSAVIAKVLTGLNAASGGTLSATDSIVQAFGKLENRVALNDAKVSGFADPMTTDGDLIIRDAGVTTRLPIGAETQVLTVYLGEPVWRNPVTGFADPMTTIGDIIYRNGLNVTDRLPVGTNGDLLTVVAGVPAWQANTALSTVDAPLFITSSSAVAITQATTSSSGYLTDTDWDTFNNKQNTHVMTNQVFVDKTGNDGTCAMGRIDLPCLTVNQAFTLVGSATSAADMDDATMRFYRVNVGPGVYTENVAVGIRPQIILDLNSAVIVGDMTVTFDQSIPFGATNSTPRLILKGGTVRPRSGSYATNGIVGNLQIDSSVGSSLIYHLELDRIALNGNLTKNPGVGNGFTLGLFIYDSMVSGTISDVVAGSTTLYASNVDTSSSNGLGAITGVVNLNVIRNVRFLGIVDTSGGAGRWFNVDFAAVAHDFTGSTSTVYADANSIRSFTANVPTPGGITFNPADNANGVGYTPAVSGDWSSAPSRVNTALDQLAATINVLSVSHGGTGLSSTATNGQLLIGNGTGYTLSTLTGTANQVNVTNGAGSITLSTPQDIHSGATPTFLGAKLSGLTDGGVLYANNGDGTITQEPTDFTFTPSTRVLSVRRQSNTATDKASMHVAKARSGNANLANGDTVGGFDFYSRFGGTDGHTASMESKYQGDGTTQAGDLRFLTANGTAPVERVLIRETGVTSFHYSQATERRNESSAATITALDSSKGFVKIDGTVTSIQGISAGVDGQEIIVYNSTSSTVTLYNEDAGASAANRISLPGGTDLALSQFQSARLIYDSQATRWVQSAGAGSGSGGDSIQHVFVIEGALVPFTDINGPRTITSAQTISSVVISALNSGTSGSTQIQVNQYRAGALQASATASLSASSGAPATTNAALSGSLSVVANDILTVDVVSVAGGAPESLSVAIQETLTTTAVSATALGELHPFVIGTSAQVTAGVATHSSFASAQSAASDGDRITWLRGTFTENITVTKQLKLDGLGHGTVIDGTVTFTSTADYSSLKDLKVTGTVTANSGADGIFVKEIWLATGSTLVDNGTGNLMEAIVE